LGISYRDLGFPDEADEQYNRAMLYAAESDSEDVLALAETERAFLRALAGDGKLSESLGSRALARMERLSDPLGAANALRVLAAAARARGESELAMRRLDQALTTTERHPDLLLRAEVQHDRGALLLEQGNPSAALAALTEASSAYQQLGARAAAE